MTRHSNGRATGTIPNERIKQEEIVKIPILVARLAVMSVVAVIIAVSAMLVSTRATNAMSPNFPANEQEVIDQFQVAGYFNVTRDNGGFEIHGSFSVCVGSYGNSLTIDVPHGTPVYGADSYGRTPVPNGGDRYIIRANTSVSITISGSSMSIYGGNPLQPPAYY